MEEKRDQGDYKDDRGKNGDQSPLDQFRAATVKNKANKKAETHVEQEIAQL